MKKNAKQRKCTLMIGLLLFCTSQFASAFQTTGVVMTRTDKKLVEGASVQIKGQSFITLTNEEGIFNLLNVKDGDYVVVSYPNMSVVTLPAEESMIILLDEESLLLNVQKTYALDEVVVEAYGSTERKFITGSVARASMQRLEDLSYTNPLEAIVGVTGVQSYNTDGQPGSSGEIIVRGISTINGSRSPLYVVDGVIYDGSISSDINIADVADITILKDAAASALYGNKAANGVIMITTKNGKNTTRGTHLIVNQGIYTRAMGEEEVLGADDFMEAHWQAYRNSLLPSKTIEEASAIASSDLIDTNLKYNIYNVDDDKLFDANGNLNDGVQIREGYLDDLDWYKPIIRNGYRQEYTLSSSSRNEKGDQYFSLSYLNEEGYIKTADLNRISARISSNVNVTKWMKTGADITANYQTSEMMSQTENTVGNIFSYNTIAPIYPVHLHDMTTGDYILDLNGEKQYDDGTDYGRPYNSSRNIVWECEDISRMYERTNLNGRAYVDINPIKDLTISAIGSGYLRDNHYVYNYGVEVGDFRSDGRMYDYDMNTQTYTFQQQIRWRHTFASKHFAEVFLGHENYFYNYNYKSASKSKQSVDDVDAFSNYSEIKDLNGYSTASRTESYLGRLRYAYGERYVLEASMRKDGSSRFAKENRWGNFGSVGASWLISNEEFMYDAEAVDFMKLRFSYGSTGNDRSVGENEYNNLYLLTRNAEKGAAYISQNISQDLKWESVFSTNIAIETRLFNRLNLSLEYYNKLSKDLIFYKNLSLSDGLVGTEIYLSSPTRAINLGEVSNRGIEVDMDIDIVKRNHFVWNVGANITTLSNKVLSIPEANREKGILNGMQKVMEGHSLYEWWLPQYVGVDRATGQSLYKLNLDDYYLDGLQEAIDGKDPIAAANQTKVVKIGETYYTTDPTSIYVKYDYSGSSLPNFYGAVSTSVAWRSLSLYVLGTYSIGGKVYDAEYQQLMSSTGTSIRSLHQDAIHAWRPENAVSEDDLNRIDSDGVPQLNYSMSQFNNANSTRFLTDASYFMLKNVTLKYQLPREWFQNKALQGISLKCSMENLFMLTAREGMNPLQNVSGNCTAYSSTTPRVISISININI